jgi:hypothetical protein
LARRITFFGLAPVDTRVRAGTHGVGCMECTRAQSECLE